MSVAAAERARAAKGGRGPGGTVAASLWTLYVLTLRQHLHGRRWVVMGALFLLPAVLAVLMRATAPNLRRVELEFLTAFMFIPQALLPLVGLLYASGMIQDEQEEQTITYLLIRPIPKWGLYGVKLLATLTTTVVLTAAFTGVTYAAIYWGGVGGAGDGWTRCWKAMGVNSLAVSAYCCVFGLLSLLTKRSLVVGIIYAAVFEGLFANLPFGIRLVTVIYYARLIAYRSMSFRSGEREGGKDIADEAWQLDVTGDPELAEHPGLGTCVMVLVLGSLVCAVLGAVVCMRREFHVKTPEKN
jgi:ABC-2 type transport system permease protein